MTHFATLSKNNKFSFVCPIFNAEVQMRSCVLIRDKVYAGENLETRRGCQACVRSSKCPAAEIVRRIAFGTTDATDHCASDEPKVGKLPADVLEKLVPILVQDVHLRGHYVGSEEASLIASSRERIEAQILTAPREKVEGRPMRLTAKISSYERSEKPTPKPSAPKNTTINQAAATGDLAAALNA